MIEKVLQLDENTAIYKADIDDLREQDKNARVMTPQKFDRLSFNIKSHGLESLPLCALNVSQERSELLIISGHHRVRACRQAGLKTLHCIVIERNMTKDEIISKQLSHNALNGEDNKEILRELYEEIEDANWKIETGLAEKELAFQKQDIKVDDMNFDFDFELIQIAFLQTQKEKFDNVIKLLESDAKVYEADLKVFERFKRALTKASKNDNIRSITAIIVRMCEIVEQYYKEQKKQKALENNDTNG